MSFFSFEHFDDDILRCDFLCIYAGGCHSTSWICIYGFMFFTSFINSSPPLLYSVTCISVLSAQSLRHVWLFGNPCAVACRAPVPLEFSREEYWSELPFPATGSLPDPGINSHLSQLLHWQADFLPLGHLLAHILGRGEEQGKYLLPVG